MLRKLHRIVGLVFAPFFLITAVTGGILLFRRYFGYRAKEALLDWHNWEGVAGYIGVLLAAALAFMAVTGAALWLQVFFRKYRKRRARRSAGKS